MAAGIVEKRSLHTVEETVEKLKGILAAKGVTVFAVIDHSGEAAKAGMKMPPTNGSDLRQPEGRDSADASGAERSAAEDIGAAGCGWLDAGEL